MRKLLLPLAAVVLSSGAFGCSGNTPESNTAPDCPLGDVCVDGTVRWVSLEGGFFAVAGDDGKNYDVSATLPSTFTHDGMRVHMVAKPRPDLASFHMYGEIVDVVAMQELK